MELPKRNVEFKKAVLGDVPLIIGVTGTSGSGKTYSALRLATGIQQVVGGDIFGIDTESNRMRHYSDKFNFKHYNFEPPHGPLDYLVAIEAAVKAGAKIILIDSMTHEHSGEGGVLDQIENFLQAKCGDDYNKRNTFNMLAQVKPKAQRKVLNRRIVALGHIIFILCYRAADKIKPPKKGSADREMVHLGWQPETTSPLVYEMTARFLLTPGCEGRPTFNPETDAEKMATKNPEQFKGWFQQGLQLNEELGRRMAEWATQKHTAPASQPPQAPIQQTASAPAPATHSQSVVAKRLEADLRSSKTMAELINAYNMMVAEKKNLSKSELDNLYAVKHEMKEWIEGGCQ